MEVESNPDGTDAATRFRRAVTHDNGGVLFVFTPTEPFASLLWRNGADRTFQPANGLLQGLRRHPPRATNFLLACRLGGEARTNSPRRPATPAREARVLPPALRKGVIAISPSVGAVGFVLPAVSSPAAGHILVCMTLTTGRRMRKKTQPVMMPAMASMPKKRSLVMTEYNEPKNPAA
jgi:hypothetical protein